MHQQQVLLHVLHVILVLMRMVKVLLHVYYAVLVPPSLPLVKLLVLNVTMVTWLM